MNLEELRRICNSMPYVTEDIKWENDLCFCIADKLFCVTNLESPLNISLKVKDEEFDELCSTNAIVPAPYLARYKWISVRDVQRFSKKEWEKYIQQSYTLVKNKLPKSMLKKL